MVFPPFFYVVWQHRQELWLITTLSKFLGGCAPACVDGVWRRSTPAPPSSQGWCCVHVCRSARPTHMHCAVAVVPTILTTLNVYWFTRIVLGAYKVLFGKKKAKVE